MDITGRKIKGFKFESGTNGITYYKEMDKYVGRLGEVVFHYRGRVVLWFDDFDDYEYYCYPASLAFFNLK